MKIKMTETAINRVRREAAETGRRIDASDADHPRLCLRCSPKGAAVWVLACRDRAGVWRRHPLGAAWPAVGVADARKQADVLYGRIVGEEAADPIGMRREARAKAADAAAGINTLAALLDLYERQKGGKLRSWPEYRRSIARVFGDFLACPLGDLKLSKLQMTADAYGAMAQASLAVRCLRPVLKWAGSAGRGYVAADLAGISPPATVQRRARVLDRDELARLLPVLRGDTGPYAGAMNLMLLTLLRRSEADGARWRDVDWEARTLTIEAARSKNAQKHVVSLPWQAVDLLQARLPENADPAALIFGTRGGNPLPNWDRATKAVHAASGTSAWHRHDLRRTGATMLGEMGELPDIIEATLNHTSIRSALAATYNRSRYRPQVAAALQRLADALDGIAAGAGAVVPLHRSAG